MHKKIQGIIETLKIHWKNKAIHNDISYYAFILSLLPIPGLQQVAQIVDRIFSNKELNIRFDELWYEIISINSKLNSISDDTEKLQEIAGTVKYNEKIHNELLKVINETIDFLKHENSEWIMLTENWSYQEVINSLVDVDYAKIIARNGSTNVVENTEIKAQKTLLHALNQSKNFVDNTTFKGTTGSVGMKGITTQGNITVEGSGIGLSKGSSIIFGGNPNIVKGDCLYCKKTIQIDKRQLDGYTRVKCPFCNSVMPFRLP